MDETSGSTGEAAAILVPCVVAGSSLLLGGIAWAVVFALGAIPVAIATVRIHRRRGFETMRGLEGLGWVYLIVVAIAIAVGGVVSLLT